MFLSKHNAHERDQYIQFQEVGHKYTISCDIEHKYTSVTTWCHSHFPKFDADSIIRNMMRGKNWVPGHKYWGLTAQQIKDMWKNNGSSVASAGTDLHYRIECFMNGEEIDGEDMAVKNHSQLLETPLAQDDGTIPEWTYFLNFVRDHPEFKPYRTEWLIFNEDVKISGSIDMVYENEDGTLSIYDWKRCKKISKVNDYNKWATTQCISHIADSNFWHYSLQLNTYKYILEQKYGKTVKDMVLVQLHPESEEGNYELYRVPDLTVDIVNLCKLRPTITRIIY